MTNSFNRWEPFHLCCRLMGADFTSGRFVVFLFSVLCCTDGEPHGTRGAFQHHRFINFFGGMQFSSNYQTEDSCHWGKLDALSSGFDRLQCFRFEFGTLCECYWSRASVLFCRRRQAIKLSSFATQTSGYIKKKKCSLIIVIIIVIVATIEGWSSSSLFPPPQPLKTHTPPACVWSSSTVCKRRLFLHWTSIFLHSVAGDRTQWSAAAAVIKTVISANSLASAVALKAAINQRPFYVADNAAGALPETSLGQWPSHPAPSCLLPVTTRLRMCSDRSIGQ